MTTRNDGMVDRVASLLGIEQRARLIDEGVLRPGIGEFVTPAADSGPYLALDEAGRRSAARSIARADGSDMKWLGSLRSDWRLGR